MGCASSKENVCRNCRAPYSPMRRRSYSLDVRHPPHETGDSSYHIVSLSSSTLGSLSLDPSIKSSVLDNNNDDDDRDDKPLIENVEIDKEKSVKDQFAMQMIEAKTWSEIINERIPSKITPKTPIRTPPGEPETIDAWEMMEGLEDISPLRPNPHIRSLSFQFPRNCNLYPIDDQPTPRVKENHDASSSPKTVWSDLADSDSNSNSNATSTASDSDPILEIKEEDEDSYKIISRQNKDKLIVYFTSLRGVRKTYEDCCHVRVILKGLKVKVDERDVSMHSGFKDELKELLLQEGFSGSFLPKVFIGSKCIGGAEEIRRLNEEGKLEKMVESCEAIDDDGGNGNVCDSCGDIRFVPCETCSGSCKIYYEKDYDHDEEYDDDECDEEFGFQRCPDCNENGLTRCPVCCD